MDHLFRDARFAVRALARQRSFTIVAVLTLALGLGATTAIFSVVNAVLLRPLPYVDSDRLVTFGQTLTRSPQEPVVGSSSHVNFLDWRRESKTIPSMALYSAGRTVITSDGETDVIRIGSVTTGFFDVFKAPPLIGRDFTADEDRPTGPRAVIISHGFWQERFGGRSDILSQTVELSGVRWPIVGVAPPGFDFPANARLWRPVRNDDRQCGRGCVYLDGIGRLADAATPAAAQQEMTAIAAGLERAFPDSNTGVTVMVQTLRDRTVGSVQIALFVLLGAVAMVLLIACVNVANLVLVRGAQRQQEIAVRAALGSGRLGVIRYLLTENLVLACAGGIGGIVLAAWGIDVLKAYAPQNLPRLDEVRFDGAAFGFAATLVFTTTLLFGLAPALQLSRIPLLHSLGHRGTIGGRRPRWRRSLLLAGEVGLSLMLLLGAGLLLRSLAALQHTALGFEPDGLTVFLVSLPPARYPEAQVVQTHETLDERLRGIAGVTRVARISGLPLGPSETVLNFTRPDQPPPAAGQVPSALYRVVDTDYFGTMNIPILAGRDFTAEDRAGGQRAVIVSRLLADTFWPAENPVGRPIQIAGQGPAIVVGVAANVRSQTMTAEAQPEMYVPHAQTAARSMTYVVASSLPPAQVLSAARRAVQTLDGRLPLIFPSTMRDIVDEQLARPRFYLLLVGLFAAVAVVLATVGIYGVVAYAVAQRTREIGVRIALGARQIDVLALMLWHGLRPAAIGVAGGLVGAAALSRLIRELLYEVAPTDSVTFIGAPALLLAVALLACLIPARRVATIAAADALRSE